MEGNTWTQHPIFVSNVNRRVDTFYADVSTFCGSGLLSEMNVWDSKTRKWENLDPSIARESPGTRMGLGMVSHQDALYLFGGLRLSQQRCGALNQKVFKKVGRKLALNTSILCSERCCV